MAASVRCPDCGSSEISNQNFFTVCVACGSVISDSPDSVVVDQPSKFSTAGNVRTTVDCTRIAVKNSCVETFCRDYTSAVNPRLSEACKECIELINSTSKNIEIPNGICKQSVNLFKELSSDKKFKPGNKNMKHCLALSCLYIVANTKGHHITFRELTDNSDIKFNHLGKIFMRLEKDFPMVFSEKSKDIESLVPFYLSKLNFDSKEKTTITKYATDLIFMWRKALLVQGFNPVYVIYSALYFAWQAANLDRCNVAPKKFCSTVGIEFNENIRKRIKYYSKVLEKFYLSSPLYGQEKMTSVAIACKLPSLIKMKNIIVFNYNQNTKRKALDDDQVQELFTKIRRLSEEEALVAAEDRDFSDSEIDSYIRTDEEIGQITGLKPAPQADQPSALDDSIEM